MTLIVEPDNGQAIVNSDNTVDYSPNANYYGSDFFEYVVCDVDDDCDTATVYITINEVNDVPVANDDETSTEEDAEVTVDVLQNDEGLGDGGISVNIIDHPSNGNATENENNITYQPAPDYYGSDNFTYEVCDGDGDCDTATVTINVTSVNDVPVANSDNLTLEEDTQDTVNILDNDTDLGDGGIGVTVEDEPDHGYYEITADNRIVYIPDPNYYGSDTLIYEVCDRDNECDTSRVLINVTSVNDLPVANDDNLTLDEDTQDTVNVLENDTGLGDGGIEITVETEPTHGDYEITNDNRIVYTPDANYNGPDELTYEVCDENGNGECDVAIVDITVAPVNDIPDAVDDEDTIDEDTQSIINVLANDNGLGDGLSNLEIENPPANGEATLVGDSTIQYIPHKDYNGQDQFDYRVTDTNGDYDIATVTINVESVNDIPDAVDDSVETDEDTPVTFNVLENDNGLGDGGLVVDILETPDHGKVEFTGNIGDSTITYSPNLNYYGEDSLVYEVSDAGGDPSTAKVYITVNPVNDHVPEAFDDERGTEINTSVEVDVLFNDTGLEDGGIFLQTDDANEPENGTITEITDNNTIIYEPDTDYTGKDEFDYQVYDYDNDVSTATVTIHVNQNNMVPIAKDDNAYTYKNISVWIDVLANDENLDDGGIEVSEWIEPDHGEIVSIDSNYVQYIPNDGYNGDDRFTYLLEDKQGDYDTASVFIDVKDEENIIPIAHPDTATTDENSDLTYDVLNNDENLDDGVYTLKVIETPENGEVTNIEVSGSQGNETGNITYNPDTDYYGTDSLLYEVCDLNEDCDSAEMIIEIDAVDNYTPVAVDDSCGTSKNTAVDVYVLMNDYDLGDGGIEISEYNSPSEGGITGIDNDEGTMTYDPGTDYLGSDHFDYQIFDYDGDADEANVKITVRENNLVPVANADTAETPKKTAIEIDVLANDEPGDTSMSSMKVTEFIEPNHGSISVIEEDSIVKYTPDADFTAGIDTFWYKVDDIDGDWDTARVSVVVYDGINHKPDAFDDYRSLDEDASPEFIHLLENDTALQDEPIQLSIQEGPQNGNITDMAGDSAIAYKPDPDYFGRDSLAYKIRDVNGDWDVAKVYLQIRAVDDGIPYAKDDSTGTSINTPVTVDVLMNDENLKDSIKLSKLSDPVNGSITVHDSTITYTPDNDYLGRDEFEYRITDYDGQSDEAKVIIEVRKDNIEPVAVLDSAWTIMNKKVNIHVLRNDSLLDDGIGQVSLFEAPSHGKVFVQPGDFVEYMPDEDYIGTDQFVYKIDDKDGDWDTASVHVTVDSVPNYIPEAIDDYQATTMNEPVNVDVLANDNGLEDTPINVWIIDQPANGEAEVPNGSNNVHYKPNTDYLGKDTLQYAVIDNDEESDTARVIINVKEDNLIPVAIDDSAHTLMNHEVEIHVLNNDSLLHDGLDGVEIFSEAEHGELSITQYNTVIYKPYKWYTGTDEFRYLLKDSDGDSDVATVFVTVEEIPNYLPDAKDDSTGTSMNEDVTIDVLRNDEGLNNGPISLSAISEPDNGKITVNEDRTITYSPVKDYLGYDYFEYQVCDYDDECDAAEVKVHVRENNTVPIAVDDKVYTHMNESVTVEVLENDSGLDDGMGQITIPGKPSYGKAEVNSNHTITYTPNYWFEGPDTLTYELSDVDGDYDTAQVAIGVLNTDTLPEIAVTKISGNTSENKTKAFFSMKLQTRPDEDVLIALHSSDTTEGVIDKDSLVFTHQNFDRKQEIGVTGVNDQIVDGDITYEIITANAISDDIIYNKLTVENVDAINEDNDESGVEVSLLSEDNRTSEDGNRVRLGVLLTSSPTSEVLINVSSTDETEGLVEGNQVLFSSGDSQKEKEVVVIGVDDSERDGDVEYEIEFNTTSEDTSYNNEVIENFLLVNEDNDEIESFIPDAFSPNNDGLNERFTIKGLDQYDNLSIKIYNRWGSLVYSDNDYNNNWDGKANVSTLGKKELPSSTYYYYLKIKDTGETIEGSVYLKR